MVASETWYPINLAISGRLCLVVGGGTVAARKISSLLLSGAIVRVVSPEGSTKVNRWAEEQRITWVRRPYCRSDLDGVFLVFAATNNPDVQQMVARHAKEQNVLINSAENPGLSDFLVPARIRRGDFLLTVSTGGASPALSALIKRRLALQFGQEYGLLAHVLAGIRRQVIGRDKACDDNRDLFHAVLKLPLLEMIRERDWHGLQAALTGVLPPEVDCDRLVAELADQEKQGRTTER